MHVSAWTVQVNCWIRQPDHSDNWLPDPEASPKMLCGYNFFNQNFKNKFFSKISQFFSSFSLESNFVNMFSSIYIILSCYLIFLVNYYFYCFLFMALLPLFHILAIIFFLIIDVLVKGYKFTVGFKFSPWGLYFHGTMT